MSRQLGHAWAITILIDIPSVFEPVLLHRGQTWNWQTADLDELGIVKRIL